MSVCVLDASFTMQWLPLATRDRALRSAASALRVPLFEVKG